MIIKQIEFNETERAKTHNWWFGTNWPVVYILNNNKAAYIGETININSRLKQHLDNEQKQSLTKVNIIAHKHFNKSAVLDIEAKLIEFMSADNQYQLLNSNNGMRDHQYYEKEFYQRLFKEIWQELRLNKLVKNDLDILINSDLFKYTPYKQLKKDQYEVLFNVAYDLIFAIQLGEPSLTVIKGEAGTGKTVLAMYLMKLMVDNMLIDFLTDEDEEKKEKFVLASKRLKDFKVALVIPMVPLRKTLKKVIRNIHLLKSNMIIGPNDVIKEKYDLLIVDEAHRLYRRTGITNYGSFDQTNKELGFDQAGTQLDWIIHSSKHQILFYDQAQSIRPSDVREDRFQALQSLQNFTYYQLESQLRVEAGSDYLSYIKSIFNQSITQKQSFDKYYEFKLFDSLTDMRQLILAKDNEFGLSRLVAGFAWPWRTKKLGYEKAKKQEIYDIEIGTEQLIWNSTNSGWVISANAINEVGSIHTIQGYDLNYAGVIIGLDLTYNIETKQIEASKNNYYDVKGKVKIKDLTILKEYIINIYQVLLTRGIKGTYVYVCDDNLKAYLAKYIDKYQG